MFDELGFVDVFRRLNDKPDQYTWWSNRGQAWEKNVGWRIDYQIATPGIAATRAARVDLQGQALLRPRAAARSTTTMSFRLPEGLRPYFERAPLAALFLGISSGFTFAMIGATLTTRLAQHGITKSAVTAFALTFLAYNFKFLWAPLVDNVRLPLIGRFGQRRSWLWLVGVLVMVAVAFLGAANPEESLYLVAIAAITLGVAGATFDIIIDAYRIELLEPRQLGAGSGMSQYGWRLGSAAAGALALVLAARIGWSAAYMACAAFALPAMLVGVVMGEPARHREPAKPHGVLEALIAYFSPLLEFLQRQGALVVLLFVLIHKIGDTLANLTLRLLFKDLGFTQRRGGVLRRRRRLRRAADRHFRRRDPLRAAGDEALGARSAWS